MVRHTEDEIASAVDISVEIQKDTQVMVSYIVYRLCCVQLGAIAFCFNASLFTFLEMYARDFLIKIE